MMARARHAVGNLVRISVLSVLAAWAIASFLAPATAAHEPTVRLQLTLRGPVPANAAGSLALGSSAAYVCLPASATRTWPVGSVVVPPCESGRSYGSTDRVPPGTRIEYAFFIGYCGDPACSSEYGQREIWRRVLITGTSDRTVNVTFTFAGLPDTSEASPPAAPMYRDVLVPSLIIAASILSLGIGARHGRVITTSGGGH